MSIKVLKLASIFIVTWLMSACAIEEMSAQGKIKTSAPIGVVMGLAFTDINPHPSEISGLLSWQASDDLLVSEYAVFLGSDRHTRADKPMAIITGAKIEQFSLPANTPIDHYQYILLYTKNEVGLATQAAAIPI
ncbi:MAG: hypothetical protein V7785_18335 [Bermanella sp.]